MGYDAGWRERQRPYLSLHFLPPRPPSSSVSLQCCWLAHLPALPLPPSPCNSPLLSLRSSPPYPPLGSPAATGGALPKSAIQRIAEKLRGLGYLEEGTEEDGRPRSAALAGPGSAGEIFIPTPRELPKRRVGYTIDSSWSSPESPVPVPGTGSAIVRFHELRRELGRDTGRVAPTPTPPMVAELMIPAQELRQLRSLGIKLEKKLRLKVGKAGITEGIVNSIHERWRRSELVKIKCEDLCRMNMKRTHEILEKNWRFSYLEAGSIIILYRGANYKYPYFTDSSAMENTENSSGSESTSYAKTETEQEVSSTSLDGLAPVDRPSTAPAYSPLVSGVGAPNKVRFQLPGEVELGEEVDLLLDGLGPRFTDWWGSGPPPVDADLLPAVVHGYRRPFRLLPFGLQPKLTDREMTILRRLSRPLPCHFALGRNRNLQGLAQSMLKLWEKCEIVKIAVKRDARNTNTELMVEELKDFLPLAVSSAIEKKRKLEMVAQKHKLEEIPSAGLAVNSGAKSYVASTTDNRCGDAGPSSANVLQDEIEPEIALPKLKGPKTTEIAVEKIEAKLASVLKKKEKAKKILQEFEESIGPSKAELDKEGISEEERFMLRKVGLRMKAFLLLGRRGVFDGTVENMHLHWKYRELVKIISKDRCIESVHKDALELESASGGILVSVDRVNKGYAIIMYRGKNYRRPSVLRPRTLLNKKEALRRSLEAQRHESLKLHVLKLSRDVDKMRRQLDDDDYETDARSPVSTEYDEDSSEDEDEFSEGETVSSSGLSLERNPVHNDIKTSLSWPSFPW
ncbi:unnamed protein product [Spirodela intermedia]|uniref:CRM domain-containing protein n=1 Tax=Spirodela intermedia TaxID=51605 RepID=A0A7I8JQV0_SPIIN|nr:unnamed protein product [Spirodela intermedia]CAA6672516.1 unnamed protein product [Spirodela intermedia]